MVKSRAHTAGGSDLPPAKGSFPVYHSPNFSSCFPALSFVLFDPNEGVTAQNYDLKWRIKDVFISQD